MRRGNEERRQVEETGIGEETRREEKERVGNEERRRQTAVTQIFVYIAVSE